MPCYQRPTHNYRIGSSPLSFSHSIGYLSHSLLTQILSCISCNYLNHSAPCTACANAKVMGNTNQSTAIPTHHTRNSKIHNHSPGWVRYYISVGVFHRNTTHDTVNQMKWFKAVEFVSLFLFWAATSLLVSGEKLPFWFLNYTGSPFWAVASRSVFD